MIDEKILKEVRAMQAEGLSYDQAWNAAESRRKAIPGDLGAAVRQLQAGHSGLSFEEAFDKIEAEALPHLRKNETMGMALIRARQTTTVKSPGAPFEVKAREVRSVEPEAEPWPKGRMMLISGSIGAYV